MNKRSRIVTISLLLSLFPVLITKFVRLDPLLGVVLFVVVTVWGTFYVLEYDLKIEELSRFEIEAGIKVYYLRKKYKISFDILSAPTEAIYKREDYFYKVDILQNGEVLYEQNFS